MRTRPLRAVETPRLSKNPQAGLTTVLGRYAGAVASLIWLIVWLIQGTPDLEWFGTWNDWSVALLCCVIFDVFSGREAGRAARR